MKIKFIIKLPSLVHGFLNQTNHDCNIIPLDDDHQAVRVIIIAKF